MMINASLMKRHLKPFILYLFEIKNVLLRGVSCALSAPTLVIMEAIYKKKKFILFFNDYSRIGALSIFSSLCLRLHDESGIKVIGVPREKPANECLAKIVEQQIPTLNFVLRSWVVFLFNHCDLFRNSRFVATSKHPRRLEWLTFNDDLPEYFKFSEAEERKGLDVLKSMGIKENDWFVCFHAREETYLESKFPDIDWSYHSYRNSSIDNCLLAANSIVERGGWAIRVGAANEKPLHGVQSNRIIDYVNSEFKSSFMDIYLMAHSRFVIVGGGSGIANVAAIFGVPAIFTNVAPLSVPPYTRKDMFIPKLLKHKENGHILNIVEMKKVYSKHVLKKVGSATYYDEIGVELIENSAEDILNACNDMFKSIDGDQFDEYSSGLQDEFSSIVFSDVNCVNLRGKVCPSFLLKYRDCLYT